MLYYFILLLCVSVRMFTNAYWLSQRIFLVVYKSNNDTACIGPYPYDNVKQYYDLCPDNTGTEVAYQISNFGKVMKDPIFMRAKQQ